MTSVEVSSNGKFESNVYTWTASGYNLIQFKDLNNSDLSDYEKIVVPVSNWSSGVLRCVIKVKNDDNSTTDYTWSLYSTNSSSTPALKELQLVGGSFKNGGVAITKDQLKNVESVSFGGGSESGSATLGQIYLTKQLDWDENGKITILPQDINCGDNVTRSGSSFKFTQQYATVTIDFIGDGISAKKLASASSSENNPGFNIYYCINDIYENDKLSTSELGASNVKKVKYAYQNVGSQTITINNFVLEYKGPITVTLKAENGTINGQTEKTIKYCETPITLPAATPNDQAKVFNAWRTNAHVGNAGDKYTPTENITLTACYTNKTLYTNELGNCLGDYTKTVPTNTVFTPKYSINNGTQKEFTFKCNRPQSPALNAFWYGWIMWAKPSSDTGNVNDKPFYFWTNAQDTRIATDANTGIWDKSISSDIKISRDGKLYVMTEDERNKYLTDMMHDAKVSVKVAYFDNTIRMYAVIKSSDGKRIYVQAYEYKNETYINSAESINIYFSVDHAYLTNFTANDQITLVTATGNIDSGAETGTVKIYTQEGYDIHNPAKVGQGESVVFEAIPNSGYKFEKWSSGSTDNPRLMDITEDGGPWAIFVKGLETINVDGNIREYGIYVPEGAKNAGNGTCPVIISLHGRYGTVDSVNGSDLNFNNIANDNNIIVVYPQGRSAADKDKYTGYKDNWYYGFGGGTGWEATGKENGDTRFIEELVAKIKSEYPQANPKRFYLCGFSMGGMMTYAIATALNDKQLFAAYASTGGFPVNQFHLNLATKMPVPFYHVHGKADGYVKYARLPEIRNNMLARYGCSLTPVEKVENAKYDDNKSYDHYTYRPKGKALNDRTFADLEYVEVNGLDHNVHSQTPQGMWDFFNHYTTDIFNDYSDATTPEWQWDMEEINSVLNGDNHTKEGHRVYGWSHYIDNNANQKLPKRYLSYGEDKSTFVAEEKDGDKKDGNGNVYPAVQLKKGKHVLHVKADVKKNGTNEGYVSIKIRNNSSGVDIVARKLTNNSGSETAQMTMIYEFETFDEDAEYTVINSRSHTDGTKCTELAIYRKGFTAPDGEKDQSQDDFTPDVESDKVIEITFDNPTPTINRLSRYDEDNYSGSTCANVTNNSESYKFYYANRLNSKNNNDEQQVLKTDDAVFGTYFQNMPHADVFERTAAQDYMRIVIPDSKITELYNGVKASGQITIGFWVNAKLAVDRKLAYKDQSIFYLAGDTYNGPNADGIKTSKHLFGIKGNGAITGYMNEQVKYNTGGAFGEFCYNGDDRGQFYTNNFYLDGNWHYITYQMYDNLTKYKMYIDAFPANGGYATISDLEELKNLHSIVLGGLNANNVTYAYDVPFAYDDIVIYSRMLSHGDIKKIVEEKQYTPSWNFKQNLGNKNVFDANKLDNEWWNTEGNVYTLKKQLSTSANLTYNGIEVIPAFRGLQFATTAPSGQIKINATDGTLWLASGVTIGFTNIPEGNSLRFETAKQFGTDQGEGYVRSGNLKSIDNHIRTSFKKTGSTGNISLTLGEMTTSWHDTYSGEVTIYSIERTNKSFIDLYYVDSNRDRTTKYVYTGNGSETPNNLPSLKIIENGTEDVNKSYTITYSSSAPQVAYVNGQGAVTITGVPGSAVITAELKNDGNYDTTYRDTNNPYTLFEDETRIFTTYEIVTNPSMNYQKQFVVSKGTQYSVDQKLTTEDNSVMVTLGGWRYGGTDTQDGATDTYSKVTEWEGFTCRNYTANSNFGVFEELFGTDVHKPLSTNGSRASRNEMWSDSDNGEYKPTKENTITNNKTPWTLPCRGSHIKVEPIKPGIVSVYVMQEGCVTRGTDGEPDAVSLNSVYITDETGKSIREVACETKTRIADQIWNNDGRPRAEYDWNTLGKAYNEAIYNSFKNNVLSVNGNYAWSFLDNWENPGMKQHVFCLDFYNLNDGMGTDGHAIITKGVVRYTFNVLPGKTYYIFSNNSPIGLAGFSFYEGKHINFTPVKERKYSFWRANATNPLTVVTLDSETDINDDDGISQFTNDKNATIKYIRSFTANKWAGICLPYSISNRQMREQFGENTKVILLNKTYPNKYGDEIVQFIWHPNQDIIAGYPYLILPSNPKESITTNSHVSATTPAFFVNKNMTTTDYDASHLISGKYGSNNGYSFGSDNGYVFAGNFEKIGVPEHSYVISDGKLAPVAANITLKPFRAYLHNTSGAHAKKLKSMSVSRWDDLDDESGTTTSIDELLEESGIFTGGANVYDLNGVLVRKNTHTLQGLPKGIYIVNGKKHVVK